MALAKLVVTIRAPGATLLWAVDDPRGRKRGLTLDGAGRHDDPLISSRSKALVRGGHDWGVLGLSLVHPCWAPTQVFAWPITMHLDRNRQGVSQGKNKPKQRSKTSSRAPHDPNHRTRPARALELIRLVATWLPNDEVVVTGDSAYGGQSVLHDLPTHVHRSSHVHPKGALDPPAPPTQEKTRGPARKHGARWPGLKDGADAPNQPWTQREFDQFGLHASLAVKTIDALDYKAGRDRLLRIVRVRDLQGQRPDPMCSGTQLDGSARHILSAYACRWAIEGTFENCKPLLGLEDPAHRLAQAVERTAPMALILYRVVVVWFHQTGHRFVRFAVRPWDLKKQEPSFADLLTTRRRVSYEEQTEELLPNRCGLKTWIAQLTALLSRAG